MADPVTLSGKKLVIKVETATPGTYAVWCGAKGKSHKMSRPKVDTSVQDCETLETSTQSDVGALSRDVSVDGVCDKTALPMCYAWMESGATKNIQIVETGVGWSTFEGAAVLTDFEVKGDIDGGKVEFSASLSNADAWVRSTNS